MQAVNTLPDTVTPLFGSAFRKPPMVKRVAKPLWKDAQLATNAQGREESFSIGLDGYIWSYETATAKRKAGRLRSTGLQATAFAVGKAPDGNLVVVAVDGLVLRYSVEEGDASSSNRWAVIGTADPKLKPNALCMEKVFCKSDDGNLFFGLTACYAADSGQMTRDFCHGVWAGKQLICGHHPMHHQYVNEFWFDTFCANGLLTDLMA